MKLCLFLEDTENTIASESSAQITRGQKIRQQSDLVTNKLKWNLMKGFTKKKVKNIEKTTNNTKNHQQSTKKQDMI